MKLADFNYELPSTQIAQQPVSPRDHARLMVVSKPAEFIHSRIDRLGDFLREGDVLVLNQTRVFPARLRGKKTTGGKVDILLLEKMSGTGEEWRSLVRGATHSVTLEFPEGLIATMTQRLENGEWILSFSSPVREVLNRHGEMPLPPYIKRPSPANDDTDRYQTIFAEHEGAVAAPTAGFHFTEGLFQSLTDAGIQKEFITLHVGWGTFRPVRVENVQEHQMLPERFEMSVQTAERLNRARQEGRRIIAVGTTVVRTLESVVNEQGIFESRRGETNAFIVPGYRFRAIDALMTNFHLPDSTPLLLACAWAQHCGISGEFPFFLKKAYLSAIEKGYRFYSYGDAMLIH